MKVKRYIVDSMPDALQRIRADLGKDAVILNTKEIRSGGFLGLFGKKKIEVIAAVDAAPKNPMPVPAGSRGEAKKAYAQSTAGRGSAVGTRPAVPAAAQRELQTKAAQSAVPAAQPLHEAILAAAARSAVQPPDGAAQPATVSRAPRNASAGMTSAADPAPIQPGPLRTAEAAPANHREDDKLLDEIRQMKAIVLKLSSTVAGSQGPLRDPLWEAALNRLSDQEVLPDIAVQIVEDAQRKLEEGDLPADAANVRHAIRDALYERLNRQQVKTVAADTSVVHFVGPTGVGKTTTIAKLAAELVLKHRRKVGLITSDTYRIAAVDQLKTYGTILNIPLEVVFSPQDLRKAFERLGDCDVILMDTAGRNYRNEMYVSELNALLQSQGKSETFLVLSMTTKYKDMRAIADNFSKFKLDKVLFTKLDETDTYGAVVNLLCDFPVGLSYVTNGQTVPDDIGVADETKLIELLLGEDIDA